MVSFLYCNHVFHTECIKEWNKIQSKCPVCNLKYRYFIDSNHYCNPISVSALKDSVFESIKNRLNVIEAELNHINLDMKEKFLKQLDRMKQNLSHLSEQQIDIKDLSERVDHLMDQLNQIEEPIGEEPISQARQAVITKLQELLKILEIPKVLLKKK